MTNSQSQKFHSSLSAFAATSGDQAGPSHQESAATRLTAEFLSSAFESAIQSPYDGLAQLVDHASGINLLPELHAVTEKAVAFGSADWYAQQAGGAIGMGALLFGLHKGIAAASDKFLPIGDRSLSASSAESLSAPTWQRSMIDAAGRGFATGSLYGFVLQPVDSKGGSFWRSRAENGLSSGLAFGVLSGLGSGLSSLSKSEALQGGRIGSLLSHPAIDGAISGLPAGFVAAESESVLKGDGFASAKSGAESAYSYAIAGGVMGGLDSVDLWHKNSVQAKADAAAPKPISLLLDGGGVRGWGHIGFLDYLEKNNVPIKDEYGVSIGSLVATLHTNGFSADQIKTIFYNEFHDPAVLKYLPKSGKPSELVRFRNLKPLMSHFVDKYDLQPNPGLHIFTFGLRERKPILFEGKNYDLSSALAASTAIPGPFRWVSYKPPKGDPSEPGIYRSMRLIDGGVREVGEKDLPAGSNVVISKLLNENDPGLFKTVFGERVGPKIDGLMHKVFKRQIGEVANPTSVVVNVGHPDVQSLGFLLPDERLFDMVRHGFKRADESISPAIDGGKIPRIRPKQIQRTLFGSATR